MFSDDELEQLRTIVTSDMSRHGGWTLTCLTRRDGDPSVVDVTLSRAQYPEVTLIIELPYDEYAHHEMENEANLSDAVFNVSIRLLEFEKMRGLEGFPDGATVTLNT